jgi:beta-lactamase class D
LSPQWKQRFGKLIHRFELSRNVKLAESVLVEVPTVIGWFRPVILVPPASFLGLSATHLEAILAHEIAHIKRHDYLVNLFQSLLELLMFYHPAVWWISGTVRLEREQACDDLAISITGDAVIYAYALIETERLRSVTSPPLVMAATGESLGRRVRRLVQKHQPDNRLNLVLLSVSLVLVCCGVLVAASAVRLRSGNPSLESLNQRSLPIHNPGGSEPSSLDPASKSSNNTRNVADINSRDVLDGENAEFRKVALDALAGREGTVVIMDPQTGQVFTVVNQDLALRKTWNPASTVKLITGMAAMDASLVNPDQFIRASAKSKSMDMTGAMAASDNAYFRALGSRVGAERFLEYARQFGFGERTGIQLENESAGYLPEANQVTDAGRLGSYGEGIEATPIQLATFVAALANGGKLLQPVMGRPSKAASEITPSIRRKLDLQPESLQRVIAGMTGSVAYGTGAGAQSPAQVVVGKTGTYELKGQSNGLFISYAPADKPRVVVVVGIRGQGAKGSEAAKIAGSIYHSLERLL